MIKHRIVTGDPPPVYQRAYRIPYSQREEMERQVHELIDPDIVEHSKSPWVGPALLVEKPDGSYRLVVDYRKLNSGTRVDPYLLSNIQETLSQLSVTKYFTVVELESGFWQIEMDPLDVEKTAFITPSTPYQFKRMPMGLVNGPAVWQRTADVVLARLLGKSCFVYMDDIIIHSQSFVDHLHALQRVFTRLEVAGLKLKPSKCQFLQRKLDICVMLFQPRVSDRILPSCNVYETSQLLRVLAVSASFSVSLDTTGDMLRIALD